VKKKRKLIFWGATLVIVALALTLGLGSGQADELSSSGVSDWLRDTPALDELFDATPPSTAQAGANRDCQYRQIVVQPRIILLGQPEISHEMCVVDTLYGSADGTYLQLAGTSVAGRLKRMNGFDLSFMPIPRSSDLILLSHSSSMGTSARIVKDFASHILSVKDSRGRVTHHLRDDALIHPLTDADGNLMQFRTSSVSFAANGRWLVANSSYQGTYRVGLETLEVLPFGAKFTYGMGYDPDPKTAISNDGRYAVLTSRYGGHDLFDLDTCAEVPSKITGSVSCSRLDLWPLLRAEINNFLFAGRWRFVGPYSLRFTAVYTNPEGKNQSSQYFLTAAGNDAESFGYLALGDSYASGEGAHSYKIGTDTNINTCHLSLLSYPYLVSDALDYYDYESVACSGAVIDDVLNESAEYTGQVNDDVKRENRDPDNILDNFLPGYINQLDFIKKYQPSIITISVIGNDVGFPKKITRCLELDTCYETYEDRLEIVRQINGQLYRLTNLYTQLRESSHPNARIYVMGYPKIVQPGGNCGLNVKLNAQELEFADAMASYLNEVIRRAATHTGVFYVNIEDSLKGHQLCWPKENGIAVNGLTAGNDNWKIIGNESYHPNEFGHRLIKATLLDKTGNLTAPMPVPDTSTGPPEEEDHALLDAPKSGRETYSVNYDDDLTNDVIVRNGVWNQTVRTAKSAFKPRSIFSLRLYSNPIDLGEYETDDGGDFEIPLIIPEAVEPGFHTLRAIGENRIGDPVAIEKVIYVAASEDDYNGNGIPNEQEPCKVFEPSGEDYDEDGIDDACDAFIGEPPEESEENLPIEEESEQNTAPENTINTEQGNRQTPTAVGAVAQSSLFNSQRKLYGSGLSSNSPENNGDTLGYASNINRAIGNKTSQSQINSLQTQSGMNWQKYATLLIFIIFIPLAVFTFYESRKKRILKR
jgi:hypothetical protein